MTTRRNAHASKTYKHRAHAASRLVLLSRNQLCRLFGSTFMERARLFLEPPVDAATSKSKAKSKRTSKPTRDRGGATLGDGDQRSL